jgi:diguanylate cyclase (GGDEF)-like protein
MEASRDRLMAIIKTQSEIASSDLDTDQVMHLTATRAQEITGATSAVIELPEGDEMVYAVTSGEATPYLGIRMDRRSTLSGLALDRDQVLYCEDTEIDPRVDRRASRRVNLRSMICVPLKHQGQAKGVLKVYSPRPRHFGSADVETLNLLSEAISAHLAHARLFELAAQEGRTDALTGLFNRRAYEERRVIEAARSARYGRQLGLCLFDLDGFKAVNDRYGHPAGDEVLKGVAGVIDSSRLTDDAFRIGGDEFAVLMPETKIEGAKIAGKRLAEALARAKLGDGNVTASYGVAATVGDALSLHDAADRALLVAKRKQRAATAK